MALPAASGPVTYDAADQRSENTYDADGNVSSDGAGTYTWNARNQLTRVTRAGVAASATTRRAAAPPSSYSHPTA